MRIIVPYAERLPLRRAHDVYVVRTCGELAGAGHDVRLLVGAGTPRAERLLAYYGLDGRRPPIVHRLPLVRRLLGCSWNAPFHAAACAVTRRLGDGPEPTLIFASTLKLARSLLRWAPSVPLIYDLHELAGLGDGPASAALGALEGEVLRRARGVVATTRALLEEARRRYPIARAAVVPLAVHGLSGAPSRAWRPRADGEPQAFYVGQLYRLQGLPVLAQALALYRSPRLHVVGHGDAEGPLQALVDELAIRDRVVSHGFRPPSALPALLAEADWFMLPALAEGRMPYVSHLKCYDYLAYARPIIASRMASVTELLTHGLDAWLVPPGDPRALADAMERVHRDPVLAGRLADGARVTTRSHTPELRAQRLGEFFERRADPEVTP